jgi:hypothetical protein
MSANQDEPKQMTIEEIMRLNLPYKGKKKKPKQKPREVTSDGKITGSATVHLSPSDPNWRGSDSQYVRVLDRWDDDGPDVVFSYDPFDVLKKGPRFHG